MAWYECVYACILSLCLHRDLDVVEYYMFVNSSPTDISVTYIQKFILWWLFWLRLSYIKRLTGNVFLQHFSTTICFTERIISYFGDILWQICLTVWAEILYAEIFLNV